MHIIGPELHRELECEAVLRTLPKWFGIEPALLMYARDSGIKPTFALAETDGAIVAFLTLHKHFPHAWEVHCMAVKSEARSNGLGSRLLAHAESWLVAQEVRFLQVKTVASTSASLDISRTDHCST